VRDVTGTSAAFDIDVRATFVQTQPIAVESPFRVSDLERLVTEISL